MRTRGCWRNLFTTEDRWEVCSIERPYYVSTVHQDLLFTNIIPQSHQLTRGMLWTLTHHVPEFQISGLLLPFPTGLGCPIACLSHRCLNALGLSIVLLVTPPTAVSGSWGGSFTAFGGESWRLHQFRPINNTTDKEKTRKDIDSFIIHHLFSLR